MAKVRINKLPEGYTIEKGKLVKSMQSGGMNTGDQNGYSLFTTRNGNPNVNDQKEYPVNNSLKRVPREIANIEAEGGETALADLNNDGTFGLYDINGPRHSNGGVPLNLPEQAFIYSDTNKLKLKPRELKEFGINSKKRKTPADVSKKFDLNKYYAAIRDEDADEISVKSAELMLDKNKRQLSKLAFVQESKKNFEDGVPTTAYPYLVSQGIDPIEFTQQVEEISKQKATQKAFDALPEEQKKMIMLQEMMQQAQAAQQAPQARYGYELPKAQVGPGRDRGSSVLIPYDEFPEQAPVRTSVATQTPIQPFDLSLLDALDLMSSGQNPYDRSTNVQQTPASELSMFDAMNAMSTDQNPFYRTQTNTSENTNVPTANNSRVNFANTQPNTNNRQQTSNSTSNATVNNSRTQPAVDSQGRILYEKANTAQGNVTPTGRSNRFSKGSVTLDQFNENWSPVIPGIENMSNAEAQRASYRWAVENQPEILTEMWNTYGLTNEGKKYKDLLEKYKDGIISGNLSKEELIDLERAYVDDKFGARNFLRKIEEEVQQPTQEPTQEPTQQTETKTNDEVDSDINIPDVTPARNPDAKFWTQDLVNLGAIAARDRDLLLPWEPAVTMPQTDYVLEDPTRAIASVNEQLNTGAQALGAFAGPQATSARMANMQGTAASQIANELGRVNQRNVNTTNRGLARESQLNMAADVERRNRLTRQYDNTQKALQAYMDEKNFDREQFAQFYNNALTNRANTYNLNSIQDYYQTDPTTGGMIGQFSGKAFQKADPQDAESRIRQMGEIVEKLNKANVPVTDKLIEYFMGIPSSNTSEETNIQRAYRNQPRGPFGKYGKEVSKSEKLLPFFVGQTMF